MHSNSKLTQFDVTFICKKYICTLQIINHTLNFNKHIVRLLPASIYFQLLFNWPIFITMGWRP